MCDRLSAQTGGKRSANRYSRASTGHGRDAHMTDTLLAGCSVLVIEDNFFLAEDARDTLERAGATVLGPVSNAEDRSEEHTSELQSLMRISYAVSCLKKHKQTEKWPTP